MWSSGSIVIPVYNSVDSLEELFKRLSKVLKDIFIEYEIILIDDCSSDNSFLKMKEMYNKYENLKIISLRDNFGQQNAIKCGFEFATKEFIITMDDDLQHQPKDIIKIMKKINEGYDVVYGIAQKKEHNFIRNIGSKMTNFLFNVICHKPKDIGVSSFRCIKKNILEEIKKDKTTFVYITAITLKITRNIGNVYVDHRKRKYGRSNYNYLKLMRLFLKLYVYYSDSRLFNKFIKNKPQFEISEMYI
ncbi:MAG: glycosyltransferase family 2 protein [Firmicutes bacterium]|nr:glycosyltransferase family 2 protein [Bacillota bacterium]